MHLLAFAESIQLFPDGTIFVHIAIILAMIWILNRTLYRPINKVVESREKSKGGHSGEAVQILEDAAAKETKYNRDMLDTRSKGYELISEHQKEAATARDAKLAAAKAEAAARMEAGKAELEQQTAQARAAISTDADKIADSIAASILKA